APDLTGGCHIHAPPRSAARRGCIFLQVAFGPLSLRIAATNPERAMAADQSADVPPAPARPPRFSWPMRVFLCVILFDMTFHSLAEAITPYTDWLKEFGVSECPRRLPTWSEMEQLAGKAEVGQPNPVWARIGESFASLPAYLNPWPAERVREKLEG